VAVSFSHVGICVADLDRSLAFYCEGLGFDAAERHEIGDEFAALMELSSVSLTSQFIRKGEIAIELIDFHEPEIELVGRRPLPRTGLTHLSIRVDDLDDVAGRLAALGGSIVESTRTVLPFGDTSLRFIYLTDPDGTRVELMEIPG